MPHSLMLSKLLRLHLPDARPVVVLRWGRPALDSQQPDPELTPQTWETERAI